MSKLSRFFSGLARFSKCGERLGWFAAFQTYVVARGMGRAVVVRLRDINTDFHLRGGATDLGSFASFYLGYPLIRGMRVRTILDGGANIGDSAVLFASKYQPELVLAVEPDAENFEQLKKNAAGIRCIVPMRCALWSHDTEVNLKAAAGSTVGSQVRSDGDGDVVKARSIPSLAREHGVAGFDLVKLDIEGAEREVLQSSPEEWLKQCQIFILELHDQISPGAGSALIKAVEACGPFRVRQIGEYLVFLRSEPGLDLTVSFEG